MTNMYSSENKAFAFVTFRTKELATKAVEELNNNELKVGYSTFYGQTCETFIT